MSLWDKSYCSWSWLWRWRMQSGSIHFRDIRLIWLEWIGNTLTFEPYFFDRLRLPFNWLCQNLLLILSFLELLLHLKSHKAVRLGHRLWIKAFPIVCFREVWRGRLSQFLNILEIGLTLCPSQYPFSRFVQLLRTILFLWLYSLFLQFSWFFRAIWLLWIINIDNNSRWLLIRLVILALYYVHFSITTHVSKWNLA